jgi:hypothetical protein
MQPEWGGPTGRGTGRALNWEALIVGAMACTPQADHGSDGGERQTA